MKNRLIQNTLTKPTLAAVAAAATLLAPAPAHADTSWIRGGNWMPLDGNNNGGIYYPSGITSADTVTQAKTVADTIAADDQSVGINFVRIAINESTVSDSSAWAVTQGIINELEADGQWVDICDFGTNNSGSVDSGWQAMWQTIDGVYKNSNMVYYEPLNEPHAYKTESALATDVYVPFLGFINKSQNHIILDGTNYASGVSMVGGDSRFNGCLLGVHDYYNWASYSTEAGWEGDLNGRVGGYQSRTVMTEMGDGTTSGLDYDAPDPGNNDICYIRGMCEQCRAWPMGFVYFPAHLNGNGSALFNGVGGDGVVNQSMIDELQNGWDFYTTSPFWGVCDFNVIGQTDYSLYRPSNGNWEIKSGGGGVWGTNADIAVPADYAGNGLAQEATWRPTNGDWYVEGVLQTHWGTNGDIPVPADYDGAGQAQLAVWRPSNGDWIVNGGSETHWGTNGDIPVPGYYNGDGVMDLAVWRPSNGTWYVNGGVNKQWGQAGDIPVPGDYTGSGTTQFAVFRPSNNTWYINGVANIQYGTTGDVPVPGDYTGSGMTQIAVWRPSNNTWYLFGLGAQTTWGTTNDVPLPLPYAIRHYCLGYTN